MWGVGVMLVIGDWLMVIGARNLSVGFCAFRIPKSFQNTPKALESQAKSGKNIHSDPEKPG